MAGKKRTFAAAPCPYRDTLAYLARNPHQYLTIMNIASATGINYQNVRKYVNRGYFEGYLIKVEQRKRKSEKAWQAKHDWWRWNEEGIPLPDITPQALEDEKRRLKNLPKEGLGRLEVITAKRQLEEGHTYPPERSYDVERTDKKVIKTMEIKRYRKVPDCKFNRLILRPRETRKTLIGAQMFIPFIWASGEKPNANWNKNFRLFIRDALGLEDLIVDEEDKDYIEFLEDPILAGKAKTGLNTRILLISESKRLGSDVMQTIRHFVRGKAFQHQMGQWDLESTDENDGFIIKQRPSYSIKEPSLRVAGLDSVLQGGHYDWIIWDDIVTWKNTRTKDQLQKTIRFFQGAQPYQAQRRSMQIAFGTCYDVADLWHHIRDSLAHRWDFHIRGALEQEMYYVDEEGELRIRPEARSLYPKSYPMPVLLERRETMGTEEFSGQILLDLTQVKPQFLKPEDFHWIASDEIPQRVSTYLLTDFAISEAQHSAYTCLFIVQIDAAQRCFVRDCRIGRWNPDDSFESMVDLTKIWNPKCAVVERVGQTTLYESAWRKKEIEASIRLPWKMPKRGGTREEAKDYRISLLRGPIKRADIVWDLALKKNKPFMQIAYPQFTHFGKSRWKDAPDALTLWNAKDERDIVICKWLGSQKGPQPLDWSSLPSPERTHLDESEVRIGYDGWEY